MCLRKKKSFTSQADTKAKSNSSTPKSNTPVTRTDTTPIQKTQEAKEIKELMNSKTTDGAPKKDEKKEPLHISVPPPRVMKARRIMKEVKDARDPEYKTLEPDHSDWDSVKILKRSELGPEDYGKKRMTAENTQ